MIIFALWMLVFASSSQIMIIAPILPRIGEELAIPESLQGTLISAYGILLGIFALIIGPISDKIGRRRVLLVGSGCMTLALGLHAAAIDYISLMIVRALAGAAGGLLSGAAVSYVGDYFPYERRGWANGWIMSGVAFGQIIGIPLGTVLAEAFGFRIPFLLFSLVMAGSFLLILLKVPQPQVHLDQNPLSVRSALSNYVRMLGNPQIAAAGATFFLLFFAIALYVVYLPTWIESSLGVSGNEVAIMFLVGGVASVISGPQAGRLSDRLGRKPLIILSCIGMAVVSVVTTTLATSLLVAYVLFSLAMVLMSMRISPLQALLTALVPSSRRGTLLSLTVAIGQIGISIGGAIAGPVYTYAGFFASTALAAIALLLTAWVVGAMLPEPSHEIERKAAHQTAGAIATSVTE
ncbi:MAG TPA: MFS transporter [Rhodothermales bacterium]|nr:MFS transporter [Rhodothermales bacterium]